MTVNKCYNESCLATMKRMPEGIIDLTLTSPPYDDMRSYTGYEFPFQDIAKELLRVTAQGGVIVWVVADRIVDGSKTGTSMRQAIYFQDLGFNFHDHMIFEKNTCSFPSGEKSTRYTQIWENMFVFSKGKPKTVNLFVDKKNSWAGSHTWGTATKRQVDGTLKDSGFGEKTIKEFGVRNNIWRYVVSGGFGQDKADDSYKHPATFPEQLAEDHILSWSNEGDLVYDPCMGSGTTAKMAILNGRNWIGSEISPEYFQLIEKRIHKIEKRVVNQKKDKALFETFFG